MSTNLLIHSNITGPLLYNLLTKLNKAHAHISIICKFGQGKTKEQLYFFHKNCAIFQTCTTKLIWYF